MIPALVSLLAAVVAGVFATRLFAQWRARKRPHALAWVVSLGLFSLASLAAALGMAASWSPVIFAVYWFAGGLIVVPFLAAGQLMLMDPKRMVIWWTLAGLFAVWAVAALLLSHFDAAALAAADAATSIPRGEDVFGEGQLAYGLLGFANYTAIIVVVGTVYSAIKSRRWAVLLIALGVTIAGASFVFIREGLPVGFSTSLAIGVTAMYAGFVAAGKAPKVKASAGEAA